MRSSPSTAQQVEHEVDEVRAAADAFCSAWKLVRPSGRTTATSPSSTARCTGSAATAAATVGNAAVQSLNRAAQQADLAAVALGEDAIAVELLLVQPVRPLGRLRHQRRELELAQPQRGIDR